MHKVTLISVALLLTILNLVMGRVLILHYRNRDDVLKVKIEDCLKLHTVQQLSDYLHLFNKLQNLQTDDFAIELIDDSGKFTQFENSAAIQWSTNFLRVLIVDLSEQLDAGPRLSIGGRAFDSSSGLSIRSNSGHVSVIQIQVRSRNASLAITSSFCLLLTELDHI